MSRFRPGPCRTTSTRRSAECCNSMAAWKGWSSISRGHPEPPTASIGFLSSWRKDIRENFPHQESSLWGIDAIEVPTTRKISLLRQQNLFGKCTFITVFVGLDIPWYNGNKEGRYRLILAYPRYLLTHSFLLLRNRTATRLTWALWSKIFEYYPSFSLPSDWHGYPSWPKTCGGPGIRNPDAVSFIDRCFWERRSHNPSISTAGERAG
jgi:hypothetical protein